MVGDRRKHCAFFGGLKLGSESSVDQVFEWVVHVLWRCEYFFSGWYGSNVLAIWNSNRRRLDASIAFSDTNRVGYIFGLAGANFSLIEAIKEHSERVDSLFLCCQSISKIRGLKET